jgi:dCTP deaminase
VVGIVHDKSSLARRGLAVQNTILDPGWHGYMTLELTNGGHEQIELPKGSAIAQVVFHMLDHATELPYRGKYQNQERNPTVAK